MKKKICFFSFLLPFLSMMAIFIGNSIYPFGDQSFMHSDMYHQYVPFLEEFVRKVRDGEPLYYSWHIGMGSNYHKRPFCPVLFHILCDIRLRCRI